MTLKAFVSEGIPSGCAKFTHMQSHQSQFGQKGGALRGINHEQKGAVQYLFESNSWPWNVEVTDVCGLKA